MKVRKSSIPLQFKLKLYACNKLVSVECAGYESEVFMPKIINGRIALVNIIADRRCCGSVMTESHHTICSPLANKMWHHETKVDYANQHQNSPMADSTVPRKRIGKENVCKARTSLGSTSSFVRIMPNQSNESIASPEVARCQEMPLRLGIPSPENVLEHIAPFISPKQNSRAIQDADMVVEIFDSPIASPCVSPICSPIPVAGRTFDMEHSFVIPMPATPDQFNRRISLTEQIPQVLPKRSKKPAPSLQWRKCLTPVRTYSRSNMGSRSNLSLDIVSPTPPPLQPKRVQPTQGVKGTMKSCLSKKARKKHKRTKLIIDRNTTLSPSEAEKEPKPNLIQLETINKTRLKMGLPITRRYFQLSQDTAFDKLTNPAKPQSKKLQQQFRDGCINKASATVPKYKALTKLDPLEPETRKRQSKGSKPAGFLICKSYLL